jgi:hypothetical protein
LYGFQKDAKNNLWVFKKDAKTHLYGFEKDAKTSVRFWKDAKLKKKL